VHYGKQHTYEGSQPHGHGLCDHHYIIYNTSGSGVKDHTYGKSMSTSTVRQVE